MKFFYTLKYLFTDKWFESLIVLSLIFIVCYAIYRTITKQSGTWTENLNLDTLKRYEKSPYYEIQQAYDTKDKNESRGECECRRVLEKIFKRPFRKARPQFLNNEVTGNNLELDCFNPELRLAVEYQGKQHYEYIPHFHRNHDNFKNGQYRDALKRRMCRENGIILIEVPYNVKVEDIENYIKTKIAGI